MALLSLPKDPKKLVKALDEEIARAEIERNIQKSGWKIVDHYLAGVRHFNIVDPMAGTLEIAFENWDGNLQLRYEKILQDFSTEIGRLLKMNVEPVGSRRGESLDSLRQASIGHAFLSSITAPVNLDALKTEFLKMVVKYGTAGLEHWETNDPLFPDCVTVVHPRELLGLPAWSDGQSSKWGFVRKRFVPLEWAKERLSKQYKVRFPSNVAELRAVAVEWGSTAPGETTSTPQGTPALSSGGITAPLDKAPYNQGGASTKINDSGKPSESGRYFVPFEEVYITGHSPEVLCRMIVKIGEFIAVDEDYEQPGRQVLCPLLIGRYTDTGRFYGRGYVGPQIPFNDTIERMLGNFFQNVIDMDLYGTVLIPDTWNLDTETFKVGRRPRWQTYSPDISAPNHKAEVIQPVTSGQLPARAAEVGISIAQDLSGHGPMFGGEASGRVDSASGHGFLFDVANIRLAMPSHSIADAFVGLYARMLQRAKARYGSEGSVRPPIIDEAMAGVIIGKDGSLDLTSNPIPDPWEFHIDIRDRMPRDMFSRKQELKENFQMGLVSPTQFWLTVYDEKLDIPGIPRDLIESYRKAIWQVVMLFRDGQEPGLIEVGEMAMNPEVQLMVVQRFMNKIEYSLAKQGVREAFEKWKMVLEESTGKGFPSGLMPPEIAAQMQQKGAFGPQPPQ